MGPSRIPENQSFLRSRLTWIFTIVRLCLCFDLLLTDDMKRWTNHTIFKSIIINSIFTLEHVEEADAIRHLSSSSSSSIGFADAYNGQYVHIPPLFLAVLEYIIRFLPTSSKYLKNVAIRLILTSVDLFIAYRLESISKLILDYEKRDEREELLQTKMSKKIYPEHAHVFPIYFRTASDDPFSKNDKDNTVPTISLYDVPCWIAQIYCFSPFSIMSASVLGCFQNIRLALALNGLFHACKMDSIVWTAFFFSLTIYVDVHLALFVIPAALFMIQRKQSKTPAIWLLLFFVFYSASLQGLAFLVVEKSLPEYCSIVRQTHGYTFHLNGLTPSLSTLWYLSMQLFDRFRIYFTCLLGGIPYVLIAPTVIRLHQYPAVLTTMFWMLGVLFRPPGTLYELNIGLCLMLLSPRSLARMPRVASLVALCAIPVPVCLYMVGYYMWMGPNTGEANYLYFQCLAYNVFVAILFLAFSSASLRRDKALRVTEKNLAKETTNENTGTEHVKSD